MMDFYNHIDEQNRFRELKIYDLGTNAQYNTHVSSYVYARMRFKEMGEVMGLEKKVKHA